MEYFWLIYSTRASPLPLRLRQSARLVFCARMNFNRVRLVRRHDGDHADAHVENLVNSASGTPLFLGDHLENRQHVPRTFADDDVAAISAARAECCPQTRRR